MMWLVLGIVVAVLTAIQDAVNKHLVQTTPVLVVAWAWWTLSLPVVWCAVWLFRVPVGMPAVAWAWLLVDAVLLTAALYCYLKGLQHGDLSQALPMLALTPVLMLFIAPLIVGETPSFRGAVGVVMIAMGSFLLLHGPLYGWPKVGLTERSLGAMLKTKGAGWMLIVAVLFSITGTIDKVGVLNSHPLTWVAWLNTVQALFLTMWLGRVSGWRWSSGLPARRWGWMGIVGLCNGTALAVQMAALLATQVPYLIAVKRLSLVFGALYGVWRLNEPHAGWRLSWVGVMTAGVFLLVSG